MPGAAVQAGHLDPDVAHGVTELLKGVLELGTGAGTRRHRRARRPARPAPPTKHDQTWFVGYTPQLATAVWVGNPSPTARARHSLNGNALRRRTADGQVFGGTVSAPIWAKMMRAASKGDAGRGRSPAPSSKLAQRQPRHRCRASSAPASPGRSTAQRRRLRQLRRRVHVASSSPAGTIAYTNPRRLRPSRARDRPVRLHRRRSSQQSPATPSSTPTTDGDTNTDSSTTQAEHRHQGQGQGRKGDSAGIGRRRPATPGARSAPGQRRLTTAATRPPSARPATLGLGGLHDQAHLRHPASPRWPRRPRRRWPELVVAELRRQVALEHGELGLLPRGQLGAAGVAVGRRRPPCASWPPWPRPRAPRRRSARAPRRRPPPRW